MTEIQNAKQKNNRFEPDWNLVLGICDFRRKTPSHSQRKPIHASLGRHDTKGHDFYNGLKVI
jgi:hypothetical protein